MQLLIYRWQVFIYILTVIDNYLIFRYTPNRQHRYDQTKYPLEEHKRPLRAAILLGLKQGSSLKDQ